MNLEPLESRDVPTVLFEVGRESSSGPYQTLYKIDSTTPSSAESAVSYAIHGLAPTHTIRGIEFRHLTGQPILTAVIAGSSANSPVFSYSLSTFTGAATLIGQADGATIGSFIAFPEEFVEQGISGGSFTGGATVGSIDVTGDRVCDLCAAPGEGFLSLVAGFTIDGRPRKNITAFAGFIGGTTIAGARIYALRVQE